MNIKDIDVFLENQSLKSDFTARDLDLSQVFWATPDDLQRENNVLRNLLDWVQKYTECCNRKQMEGEGYHFPPIDPGISPENDWYRFERWLKGGLIRKRLKDQLPLNCTLTPSDQLTDDEILVALQELTELLVRIHFTVDLVTNVPPRLVYEHLLEVLNDEFDIIQEGFWHLDGCSGYCPGCFQRAWCESGSASCWPEDEEAGQMFLVDSVKRYVCASPFSLQVLQKLQAEEDKKFDDFKKTQGDSDIPTDSIPLDFDDDDDLPF